MSKTPEVWKAEYHIKDADGDDVDWLNSRSDAIAMAQKIGGSVDRVTEYLTGRETYSRVDGEPGSWEPDEIAGWTDSREDAEEAAEMLCQFMGWKSERSPATTCIETIGGDPETALRLSFQIKVF